MEVMKSISCDPTCGFMVRSHDEGEIVDIAKKHAKDKHKMNTTEKELRSMMKNA